VKHIYIFNSTARGTNYGIGTYIGQLINVLKNTEYKITIVCITYRDIDFDISTQGFVRYITIPAPVINVNCLNNDVFEKSIPFILYPYIIKGEINIFHLNYLGSEFLSNYLKLFYKGTIVSTVHYTDWSLSLMGDRNKLNRILKRVQKSDNTSNNIIRTLEKEREFLNACDKIISISQHSNRDLVKYHKVDENKLFLINNALSIPNIYNAEKKLSIREKYFINSNEIVLFFVGRLDTIKGVEILINSFKYIIKKYSNALLIVAGEGSFEKYIVESLPIWSKIIFTGFLSKNNLQELYNIADIGIIPSLHEEFGFVAIEMMSYKIPIIVNDTYGLSEIVDDGINGIKVSINSRKKSSEDLVDKISYLIDNPEIRKKIGINARKKVKSKYSINNFRKKLLALYDSL
jgi:glycosyltransferase